MSKEMLGKTRLPHTKVTSAQIRAVQKRPAAGPMRILLVAAYLNDERESMQRFAAILSQGLSERGLSVRTIRPPAVVGRLKSSPTGFGKWLGYVNKFLIFPWLLKAAGRQADVVHFCDHSHLFYWRYTGGIPHVVTCHDVTAIRNALGELHENQVPWTGRIYQRMLLNGLKRAQHVACVSTHTQDELFRLTGRAPGTTRRIYNGLNYPYRRVRGHEATERLRCLGVDGRFLIHVGGNQWYKNRLGVLKIFTDLIQHPGVPELKLVMVGKRWTRAMYDWVQCHGLSDRVLELE